MLNFSQEIFMNLILHRHWPFTISLEYLDCWHRNNKKAPSDHLEHNRILSLTSLNHKLWKLTRPAPAAAILPSDDFGDRNNFKNDAKFYFIFIFLEENYNTDS